MEMLKRNVEFVRKNSGFALLLADTHECALPHKGHMMFHQDKTPEEQLDFGIEIFSPIAKRIVGACGGNHRARAMKVAGLDMDYRMARELGYKHRYFAHQGFVSVKAGKVNYSIAFKHGTGCGSNSFGNCIALMRAFPSADICAASHTHECAATKKGFWEMRGGRRHIKEVTLLNTGSLLDYPDYADEAGYAPQPKGFTIAWLDTERKHVRPEIYAQV